jgi:hypothetical protein
MWMAVVQDITLLCRSHDMVSCVTLVEQGLFEILERGGFKWRQLEKVSFESVSRLRRIERDSFRGSRLRSLLIAASSGRSEFMERCAAKLHIARYV